jgi:histidyl-tRNA synthetase
MSKLDTAPYKGVQDFYPEDMKIENYIFSVWRRVSEKFNYEEYSASPLEPTELYTEKSGDEIVNQQTFTFIDRGGRSVTLRPEMTPTLARMVAARRRSLKFPLRWYSIPNLFRYERPQRGRRREHYQLNCDLLGIADESADLEIINLAYSIMKEFGAKDEQFEIRLNFPAGDMEKLNDFQITLSEAGIKNTKIDETLARGQAYYTGIVFEFFDTNPTNPRSICGGGRYDNLLELFDTESVPAVGFGWGDITTRDFLETYNLLPKQQ